MTSAKTKKITLPAAEREMPQYIPKKKRYLKNTHVFINQISFPSMGYAVGSFFF